MARRHGTTVCKPCCSAPWDWPLTDVRRFGIARRRDAAGAEEVSGRMQRRIGDRRGKPRFEIVGELWANLDTTSSMFVQNVGRGGALLDSPVPLAENSVHWVTAMAEGQPHLVQIRVRHSRPQTAAGAEGRFSIGVEFLKLSPAVEQAFAQLAVAANGGMSAEV